MAAMLQHKHYSPGDPIFRKGDPGDFLYLVERGSVIIWTGTESDGTSRQGRNRRPLRRDGDPEPAAAHGERRAAGETQLLEMPASMLRQTINRADPLLVQLINGLMDNLRRAGGAVGDGDEQG